MGDNSRFSIGFNIVGKVSEVQAAIYTLFTQYNGLNFVNATGAKGNKNFRSIRVRNKNALDVIKKLKDLGIKDIHGLDREHGRVELSEFLSQRGLEYRT